MPKWSGLSLLHHQGVETRSQHLGIMGTKVELTPACLSRNSPRPQALPFHHQTVFQPKIARQFPQRAVSWE